MTEHTKTPWRVGPKHVIRAESMLPDGRRSTRFIAECCGSADEMVDTVASDAFIVQACNAHDDLVAALKLTLDRITMLEGPDAVGAAEARAALSRAGAC